VLLTLSCSSIAANPARWAGLLHLAPSALFDGFQIYRCPKWEHPFRKAAELAGSAAYI